MVARHSFVTPTLPPAPGVPGIPVDPFASQLDPSGQGTSVGSKVAGKTLGLAPETKLVDLQVSGKYTGTGLDPATESAAAEAMDWLLANHGGNRSDGPRIALLSFADRQPSGPGAASLAAQAQQLWSEGVLVIVPAGGNGTLHSSPYVLTVGGMEGASATCARLPAPASPLKPDLAAASKGVEAAQARRTPADPASGTRTVEGTPYAAAAVAAVAAKAWTARSDLPVAVLAAIIRNHATDIGAPGPDGCTGFGSLNQEAVLKAVVDWTDPMPTEPLAKPTPGWTLPLVALALVGAVLQRRRTQQS